MAVFAEATDLLRDRMPLDLALCLMDEVATVGTGDPAGAAAADEARAILERLGATVLLAQLDRLMGDEAIDAPSVSPAQSSVGQEVRTGA